MTPGVAKNFGGIRPPLCSNGGLRNSLFPATRRHRRRTTIEIKTPRTPVKTILALFVNKRQQNGVHFVARRWRFAHENKRFPGPRSDTMRAILSHEIVFSRKATKRQNDKMGVAERGCVKQGSIRAAGRVRGCYSAPQERRPPRSRETKVGVLSPPIVLAVSWTKRSEPQGENMDAN